MNNAKEVLVDTNIVRRIMENKSNVLNSINAIQNDGYRFRISDMSLFELLNSIHSQQSYYALLNALYDYEIAPIFKNVIPYFDKQYLDWFKKPQPITELKKQLFGSFCFSVSTILADIAKSIILFLANKLTSDYSSEFYLYNVAILNEDIVTHFSNVIAKSYFGNSELLRKRLPLEYRDLVLRVLTYHSLLSYKNTFTEKEFQKEYRKQDIKYANLSFKEICTQLLKEEDILFSNNPQNDKLDERFLIKYIKDILCNNGVFNINDITDYINFKYAFKYCEFYLTNDRKSINKLKNYFTLQDIKNFIMRSENFINIYFNKMY